MGESIVLAAGRPTPPIGPVIERGEGVAIVLSGSDVAAWKAGGISRRPGAQGLLLPHCSSEDAERNIYTSFPAMFQRSLLAELTRTSFSTTCRMPWMPYHLVTRMSFW